jgi:hypothetical protein
VFLLRTEINLLVTFKSVTSYTSSIMIKNKLFAIGTIAIVTVMNLTMFAHSASAVECSDNGVDTAICVDEYGNAAISTIDDEGNQITVDSDGNYEIEFAE